MNGLREKFRNKKGFTLIEMLIVVAIIAILIAVSIPLVSSALEKARHATDQANYRSAAALANIAVLTDGEDANGHYTYVVDGASQGKLKKDDDTTTTGESVKAQCRCSSGPNSAKEGATLEVTIATGGVINVEWKAAAPAPGP